jgi:BMFP domain-containing protein YqiC
MKKLMISTLAAALAMSFAVTAQAAAAKQKVATDVQASCKAQAAKKFSAIHVLKRNNFVKDCVAQHANAKAKPAATAQAPKPATAKPATTGQAPKAQ